MSLGAHISIAGVLSRAEEKAMAMGANCMQIFSSSPRDWGLPHLPDYQFKLSPVYFHATYLINLADTGEIGERSKKLLIAELNLASRLGIKGSIVHPGSFKGDPTEEKFAIFLDNIAQVLKNIPKNSCLILENAGNKKIGQDLVELGAITNGISDSRLKFCLDTCHLQATGYDLSIPGKIIDLFDDLIGLGRLELIHVNDSKDPMGSFRDRHENIGEGTIGLQNFKKFINEPRLSQTPFILEVPGFDGQGPDRENLDILKNLVQ